MFPLIEAVQHVLHHCRCVWDLQAEMLEENVSLAHCSLQLGRFVHHKHTTYRRLVSVAKLADS